MATKHMEAFDTTPHHKYMIEENKFISSQQVLNKLTDKIDELSHELGETPEYPPLPQRYFMSPQGEYIDMTNVHILHQGVDTIKQLYSGIPHYDTFQEIETEYQRTIGAIMTLRTATGTYDFMLGSGGRSGYAYRLQNNELGIIIFFCSRYKKLKTDDVLPAFTTDTEPYSHLKIECSPHLLCSTPVHTVQQMLDGFAAYFLQQGWQHSGIAAHLCVDVQGWDIPPDFEQRLVTRAKPKDTYLGMQSMEFDGGEVAVIYGRRESITYGTASFTQFSIYDKTREATKSDKIETWEEIWQSNSEIPELPSPYQQGQTVRRFEIRFHHRVIDQFTAYLAANPTENGLTDGLEPEMKTYAQLYQWLPSLWLYGLTSYRLQHSSTYIDPMWTILMTQVNWGVSQVRILKREYGKTTKGYTPSIDRLISLYLGCVISLYARKGYNSWDVFDELQKQGIFDYIVQFYEQRYYTWDWAEVQSHIMDDLDYKITQRRLAGNAVF